MLCVDTCNMLNFLFTAGFNRSNTAVQVVLKQPCLTGGWKGTVPPKREPTGRTDLSDRSWLVLCNRSQELIGQACQTRRQVLWSDSACPTTGWAVPVWPPVKHGCLSTAQTAVFNWLMPAVILDAFANKLKLCVNMFSARVMLWIFCQRFCPGVVDVKSYRLLHSEMKFCQKLT
jgi:hypothetical protein